MERMEEKYIILKVSQDNIDLTDLIAKQAEFNFDIIRSIWYIQDKVSSITLDNKFQKTFCICDEYVINLFVCICEVRKGT
jgi:hypothetical protein